MVGLLRWNQEGRFLRPIPLREVNILHVRFLCADMSRGERMSAAAERRKLRSAGKKLLRQGIGNAAKKPPYDTLGIQVIGPAPAPVVKVNGVYRYRLLVLGQNIAPIRELLAGFMRAFVQRPENRRLHIYTDCDKMD